MEKYLVTYFHYGDFSTKPFETVEDALIFINTNMNTYDNMVEFRLYSELSLKFSAELEQH